MSAWGWIQRMFVPKADEEQEAEGLVPVEEKSPFTCNQHVRIVLAMVVVAISAIAMWWILI